VDEHETPHLTVENHVRLLGAAAGNSKRRIEKMLAVLFPRQDVPAKVRKLPVPRADASDSANGAGSRALSPAASSDVFRIGVPADAGGNATPADLTPSRVAKRYPGRPDPNSGCITLSRQT
jgi:hypothetical protein